MTAILSADLSRYDLTNVARCFTNYRMSIVKQILDEVAEKPAQAARELSVSRQRVHDWSVKGRIPPEHWRLIEAKTAGKFNVLRLYDLFFPAQDDSS